MEPVPGRKITETLDLAQFRKVLQSSTDAILAAGPGEGSEGNCHTYGNGFHSAQARIDVTVNRSRT